MQGAAWFERWVALVTVRSIRFVLSHRTVMFWQQIDPSFRRGDQVSHCQVKNILVTLSGD